MSRALCGTWGLRLSCQRTADILVNFSGGEAKAYQTGVNRRLHNLALFLCWEWAF